MSKIPSPLSAPRPGFDEAALDRLASDGGPIPADPRLRLVACPAPRNGPQRYRMPLWRFFGKPK